VQPLRLDPHPYLLAFRPKEPVAGRVIDAVEVPLQQRAQQLFVRVRCYRRVPSSPDAFIRGSFVDTSKET